MPVTEIHQCQCPNCQQESEHPDQLLHYQMNLLLSRLDEQQRRWYVALEANRLGHGGEQLLSLITGLDPKTIRRGREEMAAELSDRPADRVRFPGAGRPLSEKKTLS
jgi:hypothetical protein